MFRLAQILIAAVVAGAGVFAVHSLFGLGSEFLRPGLSGVVDLILLLAAVRLASLCDRDLFWGLNPRCERPKATLGRQA
jgi:hypothetical protein